MDALANLVDKKDKAKNASLSESAVSINLYKVLCTHCPFRRMLQKVN